MNLLYTLLFLAVDLKKNLKISELNQIYGSLLTKRQRDMIESYYDFDLSLSEIAQNEVVTRQAVRDAIVKAEEQLFAYEETLGVAEKKEGFIRALTEILSELENDCASNAKILIEDLLRNSLEN